MTMTKVFRTTLALLLVLASLVSVFPVAFATEEESDCQQVVVNVDDLITDYDQTDLDDEEQARAEAEAAAEAYQQSVVDSLCEQYNLTNEEPEDSEFGYLTDEELIEVGLDPTDYDDGPKTKDVRNETNFAYIFLDFKVGSASRSWNWQTKSDDATLYFADNYQGSLCADYKGTDGRLYMPIETDESYITSRLNSYKIKSGDIARVYVNSITANSQFVSNGTATADSYFAVHTSDKVGDWSGFASEHAKITYKSGSQTLTWNVANSRVGDTLYGIRWDPSQGNLTESARIYVDYIYVGPEATAPCLVQYRNSDGIMSGGGGYIGYGKKAPAFSTGKANSETSTTQTIWGWAVYQNIDGAWKNMNKFITDPTTFTVKFDTRFVLTEVTIRKEDMKSTQQASNGVSTEDDKYVLTIDGFDTAEVDLGGYGTPLDVALVMDRSGSQSELVWTKNFGKDATSSITTYLETLSKMVQPGYYRASAFTRNHNDGQPGFDAFKYTFPMRYYNGDWQMQVLSGCSCNGSSYRDYGIYTWAGNKQCSHVKWKTVEEGYTQFVNDASATGYTLGTSYTVNGKKETLYFTIGASRLGKCQDALESFLQKLYNSSTNLKPGTTHTISVIGYGNTVFMDNYPYKDGNGNYRKDNNHNASIASQKLDYSTYEDVLKVIHDTYVNAYTRTDCAFQVLSGTVSDMESGYGMSSTTVAATSYLPASVAGRKRVVILLTDGVPSGNLEFTASVANKAVKASAVLKKDSRTTVYCIGVMDGLDSTVQTIYNNTSSEAKMANDFLNAMSSRYKGAQVWNTGGTLTKGDYYFSDASGGTNIAKQLETIWDSNAAKLALSGKTGPASLWLYEDFGREWKPDTAANVKIWAAPYTGNGTYGDKVLIGEHKVSDHTKNQDFTGNGYILHYYYDSSDQSFTYALQWTDAKTAFLRETGLALGSKAKAVSGSLDTTKGYRVYMEMPLEVDRNNTLGGNNIPLTTTSSGCYQAKDANDTAIGTKLFSYSQPNANVFCSVDSEAHDYFIPLTDYINLMSSTGSNELRYVLDQMLRLPEKLKPANDFGVSNLKYLSFDVQLKAPNGTVMYHQAAEQNATTLKTSVSNITDTMADLTMDQTFTLTANMTYASHNTDSFGRAPYQDVKSTFYPTYYVPKFAVVDFGDKISVNMGMEGENSSRLSDNITINTADNSYTFNDNKSIINGVTKIPYTYTTENKPKVAASNVIDREITILPANVVAYDDDVLKYTGTWSTTGTRKDDAQTFDNLSLYGYDAKYATKDYFHGSVQVAEVSAADNSKSATFTFTGTGFELISRATKDSGVIVAEVYKGTKIHANDTEAKDLMAASILCNTYLSTDNYNQVPVIRWEGAYGTYTVRFIAYYHVAFAARGVKNALTEAEVKEIMGYGDDVDFTYIASEDEGGATRALCTSYKAYIDGVRVYNPLEETGVVKTIYNLAGECDATFQNLRDVIVDADKWTGTGANGLLYLSDRNSNADYDDTLSSETAGFPLFMDDSVKTEVVTVKGADGTQETRTYYLNAAGKRYKDPKTGQEFWSMRRNGGYYYFIVNPNATASKPYLTLSRAYVRTILGTDFVYYNSAYKSFGSKSEIYLTKGNGVAFTANGERLQLSLRSVNGKACTVEVYQNNDWIPVVSNLTSANEMFYDFTDYKGSLILRNSGDGILAIVQAKTTSAKKGVEISKELAFEAIKAFETPVDEVVTGELKLSHSLNLQSNISINYIVSKAALEGYDCYDVTAEVAGKTYVLSGEEKGEYIYFTLTGLTAAMMNENVRAQLTAYVGDEIYVSPADDYSIATYAYTMMNREGLPEAVKSLCANLLRYGSATQVYLDYNTDALVDEEMTDEQKAYLRDLDTVEFGAPYTIGSDLADPTVAWQGRTLMLDSTVGVKFAVDVSRYEGNPADLMLRVSYTGIDGEEKTLEVAPTANGEGSKYWLFVIDSLNAAELRSVLTCQVFAGDEAVSQTMTYSADSYGNGKTGKLLDLCKALFAYVDEAKAFFG